MMTKEEKQLLFKDLCARLPYGVKCREFKLDSQICTLTAGLLDKVDNLEPYLRPMSSMAEKEKKIVNNLIYNKESIFTSPIPTWVINESDIEEYVDFCNSHHLDYRGLIEKGLAIEAPSNMYNIKN